jgi:type I restriction enzyme S subunit
VPLSELLSGIEAGKSFKCEERPPVAGEVGVVKVSSVTWGEYREHESKTCTEAIRINPVLFVRQGDFLFSRANTIDLVGACVIAGQVSGRIMLSDKILRFHFFEDRQKPWVLQFLRTQSGRKQIELLSTGNQESMRNIGQERIRQIQIPIPPAREQTRIVEKLEELLSDLDAGVTELKGAQRKLAQYRQSLLKAAVEGALTADWRAARARSGEPQETGADLLQRILTERRARWEAKQLARYAEQGKTPPKGWQAKYPAPIAPDASELPVLPKGWTWASLEQLAEIQGGIQKQPSRAPKSNHYPFLRVANVSRGQLKLDEIHEIELFEGELERLALLKGDVLIVEGNGSRSEIGRCAVWDGSIENAVHQNHLIRARPLLVAGEFVEAWLNSFRGIEYMTNLAATTSGLYTLSVGKISKIPVPIPPQSEQQEILAILKEATDSCARQEAFVEFALKHSAAERKNILKAAFAGQLVPQDPNDETASALLERIRAERAKQTGAAKPRGRKPRITA